KQDEVCKAYLAKLNEYSQSIKSLKDKYVACINSQSWSLQRFCQLVEQGGQPLGWGIRIADNLTTPVIPRPKGTVSALASSSSKVEKNQGNSSTQTQSSLSSAALSTTTSQPQTQVVNSGTETQKDNAPSKVSDATQQSVSKEQN